MFRKKFVIAAPMPRIASRPSKRVTRAMVPRFQMISKRLEQMSTKILKAAMTFGMSVAIFANWAMLPVFEARVEVLSNT